MAVLYGESPTILAVQQRGGVNLLNTRKKLRSPAHLMLVLGGGTLYGLLRILNCYAKVNP